MNPEKLRPLRIVAGLILLLALALLALTGMAYLPLLPSAPGRLIFIGLGVASLAVGICAVVVFRVAARAGWEDQKPSAPAVAAAAPPKPVAAAMEKPPGEEALLLLSMLQEKGRFVDFVMEDIASYSNEQVGAAARVVHQGCRELIVEAFAPQPVSTAGENASIRLEPGYDAAKFRVVGHVNGPNVSGKVVHKGWRAAQVKLPRVHKPAGGGDHRVIFPAEVAV
jgi:hypothetical protein